MVCNLALGVANKKLCLTQNSNVMDILGFIICLVSGFACFWLFFKCIDWFEKI